MVGARASAGNECAVSDDFLRLRRSPLAILLAHRTMQPSVGYRKCRTGVRKDVSRSAMWQLQHGASAVESN